MDTVRKVTNELAIAGHLTLGELQILAEKGYKSVVNLRSSDELGFLQDEQEHIEQLGLRYVHNPIQINNLSLDDVLPVIQQLNELPKPMLVHCDNGIRSSIVVLIKVTIEQGLRAEDAFQKVIKLGLLND